MSEPVSIAEYARSRGVSRRAVYDAIQAGRLSESVSRNERGHIRLDPSLADEEWAANTVAYRATLPLNGDHAAAGDVWGARIARAVEVLPALAPWSVFLSRGAAAELLPTMRRAQQGKILTDREVAEVLASVVRRHRVELPPAQLKAWVHDARQRLYTELAVWSMDRDSLRAWWSDPVSLADAGHVLDGLVRDYLVEVQGVDEDLEERAGSVLWDEQLPGA